MNKLSVKITAVALCGVLFLTGAVTAFAKTGDKTEEETSTVETVSTDKKTVETAKDETVYVLAGADGAVKKVIVSDWIKNSLGNAEVWDAENNDVYYQENIEKELPVGIRVSYTLDGKKVSAEEIVGKSGRVGIRFDYDNRQYETVSIDGNAEKIYVPFAMLTGMLLDNGHFRNVEVTNGKLVNDGDRTAVVGIAFPGLQENLGINKSKLDIPNYVEITADATDFSFGMTVTLATNEVFNNLDTSKLDSVDGLAESMGELEDGMNQLLDGSSALYDGLCTLLEKSDELVLGIGQLADGAEALKDGAAAVDNGAGQLESGAAELSGGLNMLKENNETLNGGAAQVFGTLLATAQTQITAAGVSVPTLTIENYAAVLDGVIASLEQAAAYSPDPVQAATAAEGAARITGLKASLDSYNAFYLGLQTYTGGVAAAADGADKLAYGASDLKAGTAQLNAGATALYDGILQLREGTPALVDGVSQLKDGSMQLNEGLKKLNEEGIGKIVELVNGDLNSIVTRLKATVNVSKNYRSFSDISDGVDGQVKFIYRTDEIKE